jgi:hypothetical protein
MVIPSLTHCTISDRRRVDTRFEFARKDFLALHIISIVFLLPSIGAVAIIVCYSYLIYLQHRPLKVHSEKGEDESEEGSRGHRYWCRLHQSGSRIKLRL